MTCYQLIIAAYLTLSYETFDNWFDLFTKNKKECHNSIILYGRLIFTRSICIVTESFKNK